MFYNVKNQFDSNINFYECSNYTKKNDRMIKKRQQQKRTDMLGSLLFGVTNKTTSVKMTKLKIYFGTEGIRRLEG